MEIDVIGPAPVCAARRRRAMALVFARLEQISPGLAGLRLEQQGDAEFPTISSFRLWGNSPAAQEAAALRSLAVG